MGPDDDGGVILELPTYRVRPGTAPELVRRMRSVLPSLARFGIEALGVPESLAHEDGEHVVLARTFSSLAERRQRETRFYDSRKWVRGPRAGIMQLIECHHTVVLESAPEAAAMLARSLVEGEIG